MAACPLPCPRGTPVRAYRSADALAARGHDVRIVTYHVGRDAPDTRCRIHRIAAVPFYRRTQPGPDPVKLLLLDPLLARLARRVALRQRPDVIHAHHCEGLIAGRIASRATGAPVVFDAHTLLETELSSYVPLVPASWTASVGRRLDVRLAARSDHVVAVTERLARRLLELRAVRPADVSVVPSGVDVSTFSSTTSPRPDGPPAGGRTVVFAGNLEAYQGLTVLMEAFRSVRARRAGTRLLVVSEFPTGSAEDIARSAGVADAVEFVRAGFGALPELLARADVAVSPRAQCDGFPQKLLNYMAAGRAIVAFRGCAPGLRHRRSAWLVPRPDPEALADGILRLLERPGLARRLGENARREAERRYSWDAAARRLERCFARVTGSRPTARRASVRLRDGRTRRAPS